MKKLCFSIKNHVAYYLSGRSTGLLQNLKAVWQQASVGSVGTPMASVASGWNTPLFVMNRVDHGPSTSDMKSYQVHTHSLRLKAWFNSPPPSPPKARIDDIPGTRHDVVNRHTAGLSDIRKTPALTEPQPTPSSRKIKPLWEGERNRVMSVWCGDVGCWGFGVMCCCAVMFPGEGLDLLTARLQTVGREIFAAAVPSLNSFHPTLLSISSFGGETTLHRRIDSLVLSSWNAHWWVGWQSVCPFCPFFWE